MSHVALNEVNKLSMLRTLKSDRYLSMSFRCGICMRTLYCRVQRSHFWAIKTAIQREKSRYVIFFINLQTDKKNIITARKTYFDTCKLTNVKLYLNSEFYAYDDLNLDFDKRGAAILYDVYLCFRMSYCQIPSKEMTIIPLKLLFERFYSSKH